MKMKNYLKNIEIKNTLRDAQQTWQYPTNLFSIFNSNLMKIKIRGYLHIHPSP